MIAIINGKIITKDGVTEEKVLIFNEKIKDIIEYKELEGYSSSLEDIEIIDAKNNYVSPGFIDLHIHGSGGKDAMDGEVDAIRTISKNVAKSGVTAFLPTTMTMKEEKIYKALDVIRQAQQLDLGGAKVLGAHLEGPFINEKYKGAQDKEYISEPTYKYIEKYIDVIKLITFAPELDNNLDFIKDIKENTGIILSMGHTNAAYEEAMKAVSNGVSHVTHLFNAMTPLNHRNPGVVGAAFNSSVFCEVIADKIHIHPEVYQMLLKIKGVDKLILITDSMRAGGMGDCISELGGQKVVVKDNSARLEDGTLAGSVLTLNNAIKNILEHTQLQLHEAVKLATINPATDINIDNRKGSIELGKDADIVIFDDKFNIKRTIVEGKTVYTGY